MNLDGIIKELKKCFTEKEYFYKYLEWIKRPLEVQEWLGGGSQHQFKDISYIQIIAYNTVVLCVISFLQVVAHSNTILEIASAFLIFVFKPIITIIQIIVGYFLGGLFLKLCWLSFKFDKKVVWDIMKGFSVFFILNWIPFSATLLVMFPLQLLIIYTALTKNIKLDVSTAKKAMLVYAGVTIGIILVFMIIFMIFALNFGILYRLFR